MSRKIESDLRERGVTPTDPRYAFVRRAMEDMNAGMADLDDELADLAERMAWLLKAPSWVNERPAGEFEQFVETKLAECERSLAAIRRRWSEHTKTDGPSARAPNGS